jgi:hypothetical protein
MRMLVFCKQMMLSSQEEERRKEKGVEKEGNEKLTRSPASLQLLEKKQPSRNQVEIMHGTQWHTYPVTFFP